jgi:hypothetical protein
MVYNEPMNKVDAKIDILIDELILLELQAEELENISTKSC